MPYKIESADGGYRVVNTVTGKLHARHSSLANARRQVRLLNAVDHGYRPRSGDYRGEHNGRRV